MKRLLIVLATLIIVFIAHAYNMQHYPYFENDEGTYMAQAYAVAYEGKLANYTYWYDHAPLGWIFTAAWMKTTGGPFAFGYSLYSARIFMLLIHVAIAYMLFEIIRKYTKNDWIAAMSVIIFTISPLGMYYQRRLLLDNLMTFWVVVSAALLVFAKKRLMWVLLSGIALGISILSKETSIMTVPAFAFLAYVSLDKKQKYIGMVSFLTPIFLCLSYYFLYAFLQNELFPGPGHVSLLGTLKYQLSRGDKVLFFMPQSDFMYSMHDWLGKDAIFILASLAASIYVAVKRGISSSLRALALINLSFWVFFIRGGLVINFYVIPVIALGIIPLGYVFSEVIEWKKWGKYTGIVILASVLVLWMLVTNKNAWTNDETLPQIKSVEWIKRNISPKAILAIDASQILDLQLSRFPGDPAFPNAQWFWKLDQDPQIKGGVIHNDWRNINYLVLTHEYVTQVKENTLPFVKNALDYARQLVSWGPVSPDTYLNIPRRISTNGDWVQVWQVMDATDIMLQKSWNTYKSTFITYEGQVVDPQTHTTTSEGQAYAMLRSVIESDHDEFNLTYAWAKNHLEYRQSDKLFSWKWAPAKYGHVADSGFATDTDIDIATALLLASQKWNNPQYAQDAENIISDIWNQAVVSSQDGHFYVLPGSWAAGDTVISVNPSYYSPAAFRMFAKIDTVHPWDQVANDSYYLLNEVKNPSTGLIPDWVGVNIISGQITAPAQSNLSQDFGYDAMRTYWRVYQDYAWNNSKDAKAFLQNQTFLRSYFDKNQKLAGVFHTDGTVAADYTNYALLGALLPYAKLTDKSMYNSIKNTLATSFSNGAWSDANNYYNQNWVWLGLVLAEGKYTHEK